MVIYNIMGQGPLINWAIYTSSGHKAHLNTELFAKPWKAFINRALLPQFTEERCYELRSNLVNNKKKRLRG